ncbi:LLM class F420-dependent oxidoreductase [Novosphingobium sp. G106]|uniref:LLM class F420-dependent oxidoreductase n=1 Tax=Novosphingobium sp. G106 TaxID=2849500 RepID=UPI001C2D2049|nr:LLM class F420-dependent oxidoreductase [Novosphingobium sp. G106]MBV1688340.1 LLM class F420-dependent oxidoreductase [Novosphingobium sp. G106]
MDMDLHITRFDWAGSPAQIGPGVARLARTAEAVGIKTLSVMDHYFQMEAMAPAEDPMLEGYTTLGFIAGVTERLRMRVLVTGVTYRPPGLLAKIVTTLDVLSGGRAELGLGAAWYEREHKGLGVPFPPVAERFERLEEALQICLQMWGDNDGAFDGRHYQLAETLCRPAPVSSPRPRIMIGGGGERKTLRLVAQYADACNLFGGPDQVSHKLDVLRRHCDALGRDIREIEVTALLSTPDDGTPDQVLRAAEDYAAVGVATVMARAVGNDPAGKLETLFGPAVERMKAIEPKAL